MAEKNLGTAAPVIASLPDRVALGVLTRLINRELVEDVIAVSGRAEKRKRLLPARVTVYFVLALALFYGDCYEEVMRKLVQGLSWLAIWKRDWHAPTAPALAQARKRLGPEPLRDLFERVAEPCAELSTAGAWAGGRRLMALDGVELDAPDTPANAGHFGYSTLKTGTGPFPKVLVMALAECGTHAITAIETGGADGSEHPLALALARAPGNLAPGMLVMADRGLYSHEMITAITAAGADFCLRAPTRLQLPALEWLPDGSYLSHIAEPKAKSANRRRLLAGTLQVTDLPGTRVRVVDYDVPGRGAKGEVITVITSVLDHQELPAPATASRPWTSSPKTTAPHPCTWSTPSSPRTDSKPSPAASAEHARRHRPGRPARPGTARQVRAVFDARTITVYQAYSPAIAEPAIAAERFVPPFNLDRMTWVKPSFLWMMYRSGWATKPGQERVLAISITRDGFEWALSNSCLSHYDPTVCASHDEWAERKKTSPVRVQWDPDRALRLSPLVHRAIQVGLSGEAVHRYLDQWITGITDITPLAERIHRHVSAENLDAARAELPAERVYQLPGSIILSDAVCCDETPCGPGPARPGVGSTCWSPPPPR